MKKLFFILIFATFFHIDVFAADCSSVASNPTVTVFYSFGHLIYDNTKQVSEITSMAKKFNLVESGIFAEGLATADINFDISMTSTAQPIDIGEFCVVPSQINIFLGISKPTIYLANTLQKGSCKYNVVLRHEKTHQQINKTALEYYLPIFKAAVTKLSQQITPTYITNTNQIESTTRILTENLNAKITPLVDFIKKEIATEQFKLDNKENYKYEGLLCKGKL